MRVLFTSAPFTGLLNPLVPLAHAGLAAGHEILVLTSGSAVEQAASAGLPAVDCAPGRDPDAEYAAIERSRHTGAAATPTARPFSFFSDEMADVALDVARSWRPDLIVLSPLAAFGMLVGRALDVPTVLHAVGFGHQMSHLERINAAAAPAFERLGVDGPAPISAWLDIVPPSMAQHEQLHRRFVQYVPYNGRAIVPHELLAQPTRPRVAVTLGTIQPHIDGLGPLQGVLDAARELDAEFVLALGDVAADALGPLPDNVIAAGWLPLAQLLEASDAVVHHGGAGTTLTALWSGLPQIVLGHGADRPANAAAVQQRGAGVVPSAELPLGPRLVQHVLEADRMRQAAAEVRSEIGQQQTPAGLIDDLHRLAARVAA